MDFTLLETPQLYRAAAMETGEDWRREAAARKYQGASEGQMGHYGVRVLPPRDHRRGWTHPYARSSVNNGKGGGKSRSSSSGNGAAYRPSFPSLEQEAATRRFHRLQVST